MSTCGNCKFLVDGSCMSLESLMPLHDLVLKTDPACDVFVQRPAESKPEPATPKAPEFSIASLRPETRAKLNLQDKRRDWHRELDR